MSAEPTLQEVLYDLARARAEFQLRTLALFMGLPVQEKEEVPPCTPRK